MPTTHAILLLDSLWMNASEASKDINMGGIQLIEHLELDITGTTV